MIPLSKQSFTIWEASQGGGDLCPALLSSARVCRAPSAEEANATYVPCASLVSSCPGLLPGLALASLRLQKSAQTGLVLHFHPLGPLWVQAGCSGNQKQPSGLSHSLECRLEIDLFLLVLGKHVVLSQNQEWGLRACDRTEQTLSGSLGLSFFYKWFS